MKSKKLQEIDILIAQGSTSEQPILKIQRKQNQLVHTMRAIMIIIDMTKSIASNDFKPSRLLATTSAITDFINVLKQSTPLVKIGLAISNSETCKIMHNLTFDTVSLLESLEKIKSQPKVGCLSIETSLYQAFLHFQNVSDYFHRQILVVQSSPLTKDQHPIQKVSELLFQSKIMLNVISLCGFTRIIQKTVEKLKGKYITVSSAQQFTSVAKILAYPPLFNPQTVRVGLVKMALVRRQVNKGQKLCFCHFASKPMVYICTNCQSVSCQQPPSECPICTTILVMPTDLYNHTIIQ